MKKLLHLGCGQRSIDGLSKIFTKSWKETRFDSDPNMKPDIQGSLTDLSAIEDGSYDAVWSDRNLELLTIGDAIKACREMKRILKPKGFAIISSPDMREIMKFAVENGMDEPLYDSNAGKISARDLIYGYQVAISQGDESKAHKSSYDLKALSSILSLVEFPIVHGRRVGLDMWFIAGDMKDHEAAQKKLDKVLA